MKLKKILGIMLGLALSQSGQSRPAAIEGEFVIKSRRASSSVISSLSKSLASMGIQVREQLDSDGNFYRVRLENESLATKAVDLSGGEKLVDALVTAMSQLAQVEYVEPNFIYRINFAPRPPEQNPVPGNGPPEDGLPEQLPDDTDFGSLWGLRNTAQSDSSGRQGQVRSDIRAAKAWVHHTGSKEIVVAVIDTGIDYNHEDLRDNMWSMPGQPNVHGYNAIDNSYDPMDDHDHGTHCAGSIGATGNNGLGVVGVNWKVSLMAVKFMDSRGSGSLADAIKGIDFAVENGAHVLSNSWGGGGRSQAMEDAIRRAGEKGVLFVAAAGNDGKDNDRSPSYPASYDLENVVSVASSNNVDQMSQFSNYGKESVHLMAPGENILSTAVGNKYKTFSGTSMATPHVAGAAALLLSKESELRAVELKSRLLSSVYKVPGYEDRVSTGGRLDVYSLLFGK